MYMHLQSIAVPTVSTKTNSLRPLPDEGSILLVLKGWGQATVGVGLVTKGIGST